VSGAHAMMRAMSTPQKLKVNTDTDEELLSVGGVSDGSGRYLDIHETLFYSKNEGFYLKRSIRQQRTGRTWETMELGALDELGDLEPSELAKNVRFLTLYRRMSRYQVMKLVMDCYMPTTEGIKDEAIRLLDREGLR
jgi:hypothetical protein